MVKVRVQDRKFDLYYDKYSDEVLKYYRDNYQDTHAFYRYRFNEENIILVFPLSEEAKEVITTSNTICIDTAKDHFLVKKFIHEMLFRQILKTGVGVESYIKLRFMSTKENDNLLSTVLPGRKNIGYKRGYELETRLFFPDGQPVYTISINSFYRWVLDISCKDIMDEKIPLNGLYACELIKSEFGLLADKRVLAGKIANCSNDKCDIEKDGIVTQRPIDKVYIENSYENRNRVLKKILGDRLFNDCINKIKSDVSNRKSAESQIIAANAISTWLMKINFDNGCGFQFNVDSKFSEQSDEWKSVNLKQPTYIFNIHGDKTDTHPDKGLKTFGPYDSTIFTPKKPSIAVICNKNDRGTVTDFLEKFINGLPNIVVGNGFLPYGDGFLKKYQLTGVEWHVYEFDADTLTEYEKAISKCIRDENGIDLAIVQTSASHKELAHKDSPYLLAKAKFMSNDIPVQEINIETMKKDDKQLVYILNNIALACYSKLGGNPWVIPSNKSIDRELIIGLGSAVFKNGRFKNDKRIVGLTTVFNSDGRYILNSKSDEVKFENYFEALLNNLTKVFEDIKNSQGWQSDDTVRLVFHCFKPFKNKEAEAIKKLVANLKVDFDVKFAFLHIANFQPLFFVDDQMAGEKSYYGNEFKGKWMPRKGSGIKLDNENCLVQLTGAKDIKMASHGMAKPIMIKLHKMSTYSDIDYLTQQLYYFSSMSYRSFSNAPLPVTIWYSQLIARLMGSLAEVPTWDFDIMANKLKYSRWFL